MLLEKGTSRRWFLQTAYHPSYIFATVAVCPIGLHIVSLSMDFEDKKTRIRVLRGFELFVGWLLLQDETMCIRFN